MKLWQRALTVSGWRAFGLDFFIGAIGVFGFAPFHIWPLTLLTFIWLISRMAYGSGGFWPAFRIGIGYFMANMFWVGTAFIERGPEFIPAMPPMILGLAALLALFWGLSGWIYRRFFKSTPPNWVALTAILFLAEFARGHVFGGLPWNLPGYMFEAGQPLSQFAALGGIYGLSLMVLITATAIAALISRPGLNAALLATIPLAFLYAFGAWHMSTSQTDYVKDVKIRLVQYPFSQADKFNPESAIKIVQGFANLSVEPGIDDITHLVWPEGAILGDVLSNEALVNSMGQLLIQHSKPPPYWLINSLRTEQYTGHDRPIYYNTSAAISYDQNGVPTLKGFTDKYRLVPFGEIIPGGKLIENLGAKILATSLSSITPSDKKILTDFPGLPLGSAQICYEIVFSGLTPRSKERRAMWILNQSNDAWFGKSIGPAHHANIAAYRAIEEGVPIIRSASSGVTGLIDPYGRYTSSLAPNESGVLDVFLPTARQRYFPGKNLNFAIALISAIILLILSLSYRRNAMTGS